MSKTTKTKPAARSPKTAHRATINPPVPKASVKSKDASRKGSKLDRIVTLMRRPVGASISQMMKETGWQAHSVRGAISGGLKKKLGLAIESEKKDGGRVYRIGPAA